MSVPGPLGGLRVVDLTDDLGRFAAKLLAEYGASVCRPAGAGSRGRPMTGPRSAAVGGVLDWWFDSSKSTTTMDLDTPAGIADYRALAEVADVIIEAKPIGYLADRGVDHGDLVATNPRLTQVSVTPFGRTGPRAAWQTSDLVAGALGGVLSLTGTPDEPLNSWGWQNYNFAGFSAAICALAGVRSAGLTGHGQLVDLSLHEVVAGSIENLLMQYFYDDELPMPKLALRQGSLHWLGAYEVVPAKTGNVMITPTPQPAPLVDWMVEAGIEEARPFVGMEVEELLERMPELMAAMKAFTATRDAGELFTGAQERHVAFGEVQNAAQALDNPQFAHRGLYSDIELGSGEGGGDEEKIRAPWRLVRFSETPIGAPAAPPGASTPMSIIDEWTRQRSSAPGPGPSEVEAAPRLDRAARPLEGMTIIDFSWVLAGPFATRLLGDLGADVIKVQTEERATLVNQPEYPYYPVWNRSKRSVTIDLKHPEALPIIRELIQSADILVENYSSGVLSNLGLGWDEVHTWNDQLVYISMSGCGHDGPWKDIISYAPTIHALCGLTYLTNPAGRGDIGCGFSLNDHAAGFGAALSVLAAVQARAELGKGQYIDMAQLEVGAFLIGPAILDLAANGYQAEPVGNVDAMADHVPNEVFRCADGRHIAVTATSDEMWARLAPIIGLDLIDLESVQGRQADRATIDAALGGWCRTRVGEKAMTDLQAAGIAAGVVQNAEDLAERDEQLAARQFWLTADLANFGPRRHDRFPALWSESDLEPYRPAPGYLGEANFDVWTEAAGLEFDEVAEGIASGLFT
ncbi:MAG: CoA transferase [Actinomycetia bacterium]|nr:CoA transferase [Actinomycetes bacterium]